MSVLERDSREWGQIVPPDRRRIPIKCPEHGMVYPPCLACQIEDIKKRKKRLTGKRDVGNRFRQR